MSMYRASVATAQVVGERSLLILFNDGMNGVVQLTKKELKGPLYRPLRDPEYFKRVRVDPDLGTVVWPNGADFAPDRLYDELARGDVIGKSFGSGQGKKAAARYRTRTKASARKPAARKKTAAKKPAK